MSEKTFFNEETDEGTLILHGDPRNSNEASVICLIYAKEYAEFITQCFVTNKELALDDSISDWTEEDLLSDEDPVLDLVDEMERNQDTFSGEWDLVDNDEWKL